MLFILKSSKKIREKFTHLNTLMRMPLVVLVYASEKRGRKESGCSGRRINRDVKSANRQIFKELCLERGEERQGGNKRGPCH